MNKNTQGILIISLVLLFVATALGFRYSVSLDKPKYNPQTLCPMSGEYPVVCVLIDKTDIWEENAGKQLSIILKKIKNNLSVYERLVIYVLDESGNKQVFNMCNPGNGDQANSLYENPRKIKYKFDQKFSNPLDLLIPDLTKPGVAKRSPLIETIQKLNPTTNNDQLIIISDLMQNSETISFYKDLNKLSSKSSIKLIGNKNIKYRSVQVYFIDRSNLTQKIKDSVLSFWDNYLKQIADEVSISNFPSETIG